MCEQAVVFAQRRTRVGAGGERGLQRGGGRGELLPEAVVVAVLFADVGDAFAGADCGDAGEYPVPAVAEGGGKRRRIAVLQGLQAAVNGGGGVNGAAFAVLQAFAEAHALEALLVAHRSADEVFVEDEGGGDGGSGGAHACAQRQLALAAETPRHGQVTVFAESGQRQVLEEGGEAVDDEVVRAVQDVLYGALTTAVLVEALVEFFFEALQCGGAVVFACGDAGERGADGAAAVQRRKADGGVAADGADDGGSAIDDGVFAAQDDFAGGAGAFHGVVFFGFFVVRSAGKADGYAARRFIGGASTTLRSLRVVMVCRSGGGGFLARQGGTAPGCVAAR